MPPTSIDGTDITGATIDGTDVTEITVDGQTVFSKQVGPATLTHQYLAENFTGSSWTDSVGSADMTVSGLTSSTFAGGLSSVASDGVDDFGTADGPQDLPQNETFGLGFTLQGTDKTDGSDWMFLKDGNNRFNISDSDFFDGSVGEILFQVSDSNNNRLRVETNTDVMDGSAHTIIINKNGNDASDIDIYIDDMTTPVTTNIRNNMAFNHTNYSPTLELGFFARNGDGTITNHKSFDTNIWEFNSAPYNLTQRSDFKTRAGI